MSEPSPLVPAEVDLRGLPWMPIDTVRLLDSDLNAIATAEEFRAAVRLWCKAWHQRPAASLPDDDRILATLSGCGSRWKKLREVALRGFVRCADGRLYHPVIAEKALEAWAHRKAQRMKAAKRWQNTGTSSGDAAASAPAMQGTGTGTETGTEKQALRASSGEAPDRAKPARKNGNGHDHDAMRVLRQQAIEVLEFLNAKAGKNYQPVKSNIDLIVARLREGGTADDMRAIIAKKCREWQGREGMEEYLRPATLFGPKNFWQKYQGELAPAGAH